MDALKAWLEDTGRPVYIGVAMGQGGTEVTKEAPAGTAPVSTSRALSSSHMASVTPRPIERVMPVYPEAALKERVRGVVVLRVLVSEAGQPIEVTVKAAARKDLTDAAVAAARQWRFEPARRNGVAVRGYAEIRFPFEGVQFARTPFPGDFAGP